jgi:hypothetical protein
VGDDFAFAGNHLYRLAAQLFADLSQCFWRQRAGHGDLRLAVNVITQWHYAPAQGELIGQGLTGLRRFAGHVEHPWHLVLERDGFGEGFIVEPAIVEQNAAQRHLPGLLLVQGALQVVFVDRLPRQQHAAKFARRNGYQVSGREIVHGLVPDQLAIEQLADQEHAPCPGGGHEVDEVAHHHARDRQQTVLPAVEHRGEVATVNNAPGQGDTVGQQQVFDPAIGFERRREADVPQAALAQDDQRQQLHQDQIGNDADKRGDHALAVAEQQVAVGQRAGPAHLFPALQANTQGPARLLAKGSAEGIGKEFAHAQGHAQG